MAFENLVKKAKTLKWWKILIIAIVAVFVLAAGGLFYYSNQIKKINYVTIGDNEGGQIVFDENNPVLNVLLIGTDDSGEQLKEGARADSIMIVSANFNENTIKLVSLERAIGVPIEEVGYDWLTHVFAYSGAKGLVKTVKEEFHVDISGYVRVNFTAFEKIIDVLGGVEIPLTKAEADALQPITRGEMKTGSNFLGGYDALMYARLRYIDNDFQRMQRQRTVIQAVVDEAESINISEFNQILDQVLPLIETSFTPSEITYVVMQAPRFLGQKIDQLALPEKEDILTGVYTSDGRILTRIDFKTVSEKLHFFLYGEMIEIEVDDFSQDMINSQPKYNTYSQPETSSEAVEEAEISPDAPPAVTSESVQAEPEVSQPVRLRDSNGVDLSTVIPAPSKVAEPDVVN